MIDPLPYQKFPFECSACGRKYRLFMGALHCEESGCPRVTTKEAHAHGPDNPCPDGCLYCTGIFVSGTHSVNKEAPDSAEVTEAIKIMENMYPDA